MMKREHSFSNIDNAAGTSPPEMAPSAGKSKLWEDDTGMDDELLAVMGYKVRSSDMAEVALKLEQLIGIDQEDMLSHIASETVHKNPSNLLNWFDSMLSECNANPNFDSSPSSISSIIDPSALASSSADPYSDSDLKAIPGKAILTPPPCSISNDNSMISSCSSSNLRESKRLKPSNSNYASNSSRPVVLVDSQENGIRLVHTLMACAEAIQQENMAMADALVKPIRYLAASQDGSMGKVAGFFAEALAGRINKLCKNVSYDESVSDALQMNFYETCPYLKFAHFTANQAILEAFSGKKKVHVIDFSLNEGMQWPPLMQALATRPEGPPAFQLTGVGPNNSDRVQEVGWKLAQFADLVHIQFEYRRLVTNSLADLEASMLDIELDNEVVAVNSVFELHRLLAKPGSVEKVMGFMKDVNPVIITVVEQEANHNGPAFIDRFNEALHYYSTMFDSLESCEDSEDKKMSELYLGRQICNVVACEGMDRTERHESMVQWRNRFVSAGFEPVHLGSDAFTRASMLLDLDSGGEGYGVEEREGCLMLGWHNRPLITTAAWQLAKNSPTRM